MQRSVTPLDVFNEAARFSQGVMGYYTEKNREENINRIKLDHEQIDFKVAEYLSKHPFAGGNNDVEDQEAFIKYRNDLKGFIDSQYAELRGNRSSRFYDEQMEQSRRSAHVAADSKAMAKAEQWRKDRTLINLGDSLERRRNSGGSVEEVLDGLKREIEGVRGDRDAGLPGLGLTYEQENNLLRANQIMYYKSYTAKVAEAITDPKELRKALGDARAQFAAVLDEKMFETDEDGNALLDDEGNNIEITNAWTFKEKDKYDVELLQGRCFELLGEQESLGRRMIADGRIGDYNIHARKNRRILDNYFDESKAEFQDLSPEHRARADGWHRTIEEHLRSGSGGSGAARQTGIKITAEAMKPYIEAGLRGYWQNPDIQINMYDAFDMFLNEMYGQAQTGGYTGSINDFRRDYSVVNNFYGEVVKEMENNGSQYEQYTKALTLVKEQIDLAYKNNRRFNELYPGQKAHLAGRLEERFWDIFYSSYIPGTNVEKVLEGTQNFINSLVAEDSGILLNPMVINGRNADATLAGYLHALSQPDRVWTDTLDQLQYNGVNEATAGQIQDYTRTRLYQELNNRSPQQFRNAEIEFVRYEDSEGGYDKDGVMIFRVRGQPNTEYKVTSPNRTELIFQKKERGSGWTSIGGTQYEREQRATENQRMRAAAEVARGETIRQEGQNELAMELSTMRMGGSQLRMPTDYTSRHRTGSPQEREDRLNYILADYDGYINYLREYYGQRGQLPEELRRFDTRGRR